MDLDAWVAAMNAEPECAVTMLAFADWLREQGRDGMADAIQLLAEAGKVGDPNHGYDYLKDTPWDCRVSWPWFWRACGHLAERTENSIVVTERICLAEAYAAADEEIRSAWRDETFSQ